MPMLPTYNDNLRILEFDRLQLCCSNLLVYFLNHVTSEFVIFNNTTYMIQLKPMYQLQMKREHQTLTSINMQCSWKKNSKDIEVRVGDLGLLLSKTIAITLSKQTRKSKTCLINYTNIQKKLDSCQVFDSKKATEYHMKIMKQRECTTIQTHRRDCPIRASGNWNNRVILGLLGQKLSQTLSTLSTRSNCSSSSLRRSKSCHCQQKQIITGNFCKKSTYTQLKERIEIIPKLHEFNETINSHLLILLSGINQTYATLCVFY